MSNAVLIPFPTTNSKEHIASTAVGYSEDMAEIISKNMGNITKCQAGIEESRRVIQEMKLATAAADSNRLRKINEIINQSESNIKILNNTISRCNSVIVSAKHEPWNKIPPDRIVCADSPGLSNILSSMQKDDTLYLRGHCSAGLNYLESSDHSKTVTIDEIIKILKNRLSADFSGKLKIYACESGSSSGVLWWKEDSFAKKFSDAMIKANWTKCKYYGYTEELSTWVINGHKRVGADHAVRASKVRVQVDEDRWK
jgi:hypothetical protein